IDGAGRQPEGSATAHRSGHHDGGDQPGRWRDAGSPGPAGGNRAARRRCERRAVCAAWVIRREVLGMADRQATPAELDRMVTLARNGMEAGGIGLSSGLYYAPGSYAKTEEVIALAKVVGEMGGVYESHIRDEADYS